MHVWNEVLAFREFMLIYTDLPAFQTLFSCHTHALASFSESVIPCSHTTTLKSGTQLRNSLRKSGRVCCKHCNIWTASCMLQFSRFRLAARPPQPPSFSTSGCASFSVLSPSSSFFSSFSSLSSGTDTIKACAIETVASVLCTSFQGTVALELSFRGTFAEVSDGSIFD